MTKPLGHKAPQDHTGALTPSERFAMRPIAIARSPYKERFGAPRQASVTRETRDGEVAEGVIELLPEIPLESLRSLEGFDYLWVIYVFHLNDGASTGQTRWPALVRPPRDPEHQHGLFATRAPHRPNPIGLSALRIARIEGRAIHVRGLDLLDGTPVIDLKPYVPYADAFPDAKAGWVDEAEARGRR
ncbi:MAG: tRNA (N6-threonylcarbamoyladenosine(37)-N6)-methyltransferase TrmO [Sandaracinaceae bacterium]|nr:tRNA (N6-threonylcarbamoyladenosine(37)-N6)-methyltransferase TrmO [Sandaracinaceae bacterium]